MNYTGGPNITRFIKNGRGWHKSQKRSCDDKVEVTVMWGTQTNESRLSLEAGRGKETFSQETKFLERM